MERAEREGVSGCGEHGRVWRGREGVESMGGRGEDGRAWELKG